MFLTGHRKHTRTLLIFTNVRPTQHSYSRSFNKWAIVDTFTGAINTSNNQDHVSISHHKKTGHKKMSKWSSTKVSHDQIINDELKWNVWDHISTEVQQPWGESTSRKDRCCAVHKSCPQRSISWRNIICNVICKWWL